MKAKPSEPNGREMKESQDQMNRGTSNLIMPYKGAYKILPKEVFTLYKRMKYIL